jgi:hypothetical protein
VVWRNDMVTGGGPGPAGRYAPALPGGALTRGYEWSTRALGQWKDHRLIGRLGVSRGVLHESVRLLEHHDVASMRQGPGGGLVVRAPDPAAVAYGAALALRYLGATPRDLFEARSALVKCVELAANRIDDEGVAELRAICATEGARRQVREASAEPTACTGRSCGPAGTPRSSSSSMC